MADTSTATKIGNAETIGATTRAETKVIGPGNGPDAGWRDNNPLFIPRWPAAYFKALAEQDEGRVLIEYAMFCKRRDKVIAMKEKLKI